MAGSTPVLGLDVDSLLVIANYNLQGVYIYACLKIFAGFKQTCLRGIITAYFVSLVVIMY